MQEKPEQSPSPKAASPSGEPDQVPTPEAQTDASVSQEMSADEQAAFDKIMGEIEGSPETPSDDTQANNPTPDAADMEAPSQEPVPEESEAELDADQQKAFESIMAQIAGGDAVETANDAATDDPPAEESDDFSAELEKVAKAADSSVEAPAEEAVPDESEDELDADQQQAFESIMAQIGMQGDAQPEETDTGTASATASTPADEGLSAELAQVTQPDDRETVNDDSDLSETANAGGDDQQQTADTGTTEIEVDGGAVDKEKPASAPSSENEATQAPTDGTINSDEEDISGDIDDILKEIASTDDPSPEPAAVDFSEKANSDDQPASGAMDAQQSADPKPATVSPEAGAEEPPDATPADDSTTRNADGHPDDREGSEPKAAEPLPSKISHPLRETGLPARTSKKRIAAISGVAVILLAVAIYLYWPRLSPVSTSPAVSDGSSQPSTADERPVVVATLPEQQPAVEPRMESEQSRLERVAQDLDRLRSQLIDKQNEIQELRAYYQAGIEAEIQDIVHAVRQAGSRKPSFKTVMEDQRIRLGLLAIQRRDAYIRKLADPSNELFWDSEALLYHARRAGILSLMADKTSDIDIDGFIDQATAVHDRYHRALAALNIDGAALSPPDLETIWRDIAERLPDKARDHRKDSDRARADNTAIAQSVCNGDYRQKHRLTELSPETARCLARWEGKDLFLNELKELQPEAARQLADWKGEWMGLNGLRELSPEAAIHLSRWKGKGLSLNGLTRLSPRVVAILSEWEGEQIELVNVKHMAHWENPNTRLFLSEGLKRKSHTARN